MRLLLAFAMVTAGALLLPELAEACPAGQQIIDVKPGGRGVGPVPICGGGVQPQGSTGGQEPGGLAHEELVRVVHQVYTERSAALEATARA